ncbi:MAG: AAA family ATPase [Planctomycetota bacterium]
MKNSDNDFTMPPFPGFPSVSRYVPLGPVQETMERVSRSILGREAISLIIGPPGTGKSLVCGLIAKQFVESHDVVVLGETSISDEASFQRFLLHRLGVALETNRPQDLDLMLSQRLTGKDCNPNGLVLIVDEAASLSVDVLEAIRRTTNVMQNGQPMVTAVVAGNNKLDETLTTPSLESFVQRVAARCYLHPLNMAETKRYIHASIEACEADPMETISDEAIAAIHHACGGVPRLINQLMTEAIDCAADVGQTMIDEAIINRAWSSLQQLPGPMIDVPELGAHATEVEFGSLAPETHEPSPQRHVEEMSPDSFEMMDEATMRVEPESMAPPIAMPTPQPAMLFGEFDSEEEIDVRQSTGSPMSPATDMDLESMLHSEIVSLSHFAAENTEAHPQPVADHVSPIDVSGANPEIAPTKSTQGETPEAAIWYDEASEDSVRVDDSDMLWITEDVDVEPPAATAPPPPVAHRIDPPVPDAPKLNVDYRELLEKMRKA